VNTARVKQTTATFEVQLVDGVVWVQAHGALVSTTADALLNAVVIAANSGNSRRILFDFRAAQLAETEVLLYHRVEAASADEVLRASRVAMVCSVRSPRYEFLEATARRAGHDFTVFTDGAQALDWLQTAGQVAPIC
jgi:hypothetical protein